MNDIEFGKWYIYNGDDNVNWFILPLSIYNNNVFSIDVEIDVGPNVRVDSPAGISWFTRRMSDSSLTLSTEAPSFSDIPLNYEQKKVIFNAIF